jgi:hypothetical protein
MGNGFGDNTFVSTIFVIAKLVLNFITSNVLLTILFSGSLVGLGCYVIKNIKQVSRR